MRVKYRTALTLCLSCWAFSAPAQPADVPASATDALPANYDPALRSALIAAVEAADSFEHRFDAEVWLLDMSGRLKRYLPDDAERLALLRSVHREATRADLPPELVLSVMHVESRFDRYAISVAGAQGLMQIMPFWVKEIGRPDDNLFHMDTNLRYGCTILKFYLDRENGNLFRGLGAYNGSLGKPKYPGLVQKAYADRYFPG